MKFTVEELSLGKSEVLEAIKDTYTIGSCHLCGATNKWLRKGLCISCRSDLGEKSYES